MPCLPGIVSNRFVRPFFITFWWWFTSSRKVRYSSYRRPAHFESLDHYMSFFLAPATAWGPFWVTLTLSWSLWLWDSRVPFFHLKHLPILSTEFPLGPFWRKLLLFFKSSGGSVLHTSTISETSFWTILVRGVLCLDTLLRFWVYLRMPISLNEIKYTQWRIPIQNLKPSSGQLWDRTLVWKATFLKLAQGGCFYYLFMCLSIKLTLELVFGPLWWD